MTDKWIRDTGLVFAALSIVAGFYTDKAFFGVALVLLILLLAWPSALLPLAWAWKKVADILGFVMPKLFFALCFFVVIVPVGLIRKALGYDSLMLSSQDSTFKKREHLFTSSDMKNSF